MSSRYLLERRREVRLRWFGGALGLVLAAVVHVGILLGPEVRYRPVLEDARVRRVLMVQPYQPAPPPPPPPPKPKTAGRGTPALSKPDKPADQAATSRPAAPKKQALDSRVLDGRRTSAPPDSGVAEADAQDQGAADSAIPELDREAATPAEPARDEWKELLEELEDKSEALDSQSAQQVASARSAQESGLGLGGPGKGGSGGGDGDGFMDPRIRATVVSYPPTSVVEAFPPIPYPDLRFRRSQIRESICRVYYRVWTDAKGRITRRQLLNPESPTSRKTYAPFIDAVRSSVEEWPFDRVEAEIHVDVLFEIE